MQTTKKIFHALIVGLLGIVVWLGVVAVTVSLVATNRDSVKSWPLEAGVYPKLTGQVLNATNAANRDGPGPEEAEDLGRNLADSPLDRARLEQAVGAVFTAEYWQAKFEPLVDSVYNWLDGTSGELKFAVVFNDKNDELAAALKKAIAAQYEQYPPCPAAVNLDNFDPITANCLPRGMTPQQIANRFARQLKKEDFLADARFSEAELNLDQSALQTGPRVYAGLKQLPLIFLLAAALLSGLAVFSAKSRLYGLRRVGQLLFGIGLISWLAFFIGYRLGGSFQFSGGGAADQQVMATIVQPLIKVAFADVVKTGLWVSLTVVLAGALFWLAAFIWHKAHHHNEAEVLANRAKSAKADPKLPKPVSPKQE